MALSRGKWTHLPILPARNVTLTGVRGAQLVLDQYATGNGQLIEKLNVVVFVGGLRHAEGFAWDARAPRTYIALGVYKDELYDTGVHARIAEF